MKVRKEGRLNCSLYRYGSKRYREDTFGDKSDDFLLIHVKLEIPIHVKSRIRPGNIYTRGKED